jgi:hypothetical protein
MWHLRKVQNFVFPFTLMRKLFKICRPIRLHVFTLTATCVQRNTRGRESNEICVLFFEGEKQFGLA